MKRVPLIALVGLLSLPVQSQTSDAIVLSGWHLDPDAIVCGIATIRRSSWFDLPGEVPFELRSTGTISACSDSLTALGGQLVRAVQTVTQWDVMEEEWGGKTLISAAPDPYPLLGDRVVIEQTGDGWAYSLESGTPTDEQAELLPERYVFELDDAEYPRAPIAVGDEWDVPRSVLEWRYGTLDLDEPSWSRLRLDSLGTFDGAPAAFLSGELSIVAYPSPDLRTEIAGVVQRVRRLDLRIDVVSTTEQSTHSVFDGIGPDGRPRSAESTASYVIKTVREVVEKEP
jgi:hypothetical protein